MKRYAGLTLEDERSYAEQHPSAALTNPDAPPRPLAAAPAAETAPRPRPLYKRRPADRPPGRHRWPCSSHHSDNRERILREPYRGRPGRTAGRDELFLFQTSQDGLDRSACKTGRVDYVEAMAGTIGPRLQNKRGRIGKIHLARILAM